MSPSNTKHKALPNAWTRRCRVAEADDSFTVAGEKLGDYSFSETPSSPQFFLYSIGSPETRDLAWSRRIRRAQLLQSSSSARKVVERKVN